MGLWSRATGASASVLAVMCLSVSVASAQSGSPASPLADDDPLPPVPPETITRSSNGRAVVRAIRLRTPLRVDGRLDEEVYTREKPVSGFIQTVPAEGQPATERTEAWVMFDEDYIYVSGKCYDSAPPDQWTANELRRDTGQLRQNDSFGVLFDTFHDRRNGYLFYTNPLGGFADQAVTDEGNTNPDWNPVWEARTGRFEGGWTVELAIPFKSIRYRSGENQTWGIQLRRAIRRKNEWTHLTFLPASTGGSTSIFRISRAATLVGLDLPPASRNIELKPYAISKVTTDVVRQPQLVNDVDPDAGIDAKYGVTANLTADVTVNTDFAQVEVDEQQVNLTRFTLQLPEKRDFFLEGRGIFDFGRTGGGPGNGNANPSAGAPSLFYTRRIGLNNGRVVPIRFGERLTGKVGPFSIGAMNLQTGEDRASGAVPSPSTNFTVVRLKRDVLRRSSIGAMFTNRSESAAVPGASNQAYGADGLFSFGDLNLGGYWSQSLTEGRNEDNRSYQAKIDYAADRYGAKLDYLMVGDNFNPEVGFVRRDDFRRTFGSLRFSPRPRGRQRVRKYTMEGTLEYLLNGAGELESRQQGGRFAVEFQNSDIFTVDAGRNYELLVRPFTVSPAAGDRSAVVIPRGGYDFTDMTASYAFGQQRRVSGTLSLQTGHFYDGDINAVTFSSARIAVLKQWSVEPTISVNHVELPAGTFTTTVLRTRTDYGFSPRMFVSGLVQFSSTDEVFSTNFRFRWEYRPGSELFIVYTDERDTLRPGYPDLENRAFVVKVNRLFRF